MLWSKQVICIEPGLWRSCSNEDGTSIVSSAKYNVNGIVWNHHRYQCPLRYSIARLATCNITPGKLPVALQHGWLDFEGLSFASGRYKCLTWYAYGQYTAADLRSSLTSRHWLSSTKQKPHQQFAPLELKQVVDERRRWRIRWAFSNGHTAVCELNGGKVESVSSTNKIWAKGNGTGSHVVT